MSSELFMKVNGRDLFFENFTKKSLLELLEELGINPKTVAVELNGAILNREEWAVTFLQDSDKIEVIKFVGGG